MAPTGGGRGRAEEVKQQIHFKIRLYSKQPDFGSLTLRALRLRVCRARLPCLSARLPFCLSAVPACHAFPPACLSVCRARLPCLSAPACLSVCLPCLLSDPHSCHTPPHPAQLSEDLGIDCAPYRHLIKAAMAMLAEELDEAA